MLNSDETSRLNASEQLVNITSKHALEFEVDDVILSTTILEKLVGGVKDLNKTGSNIVKTVNYILNMKSSVVSESQTSRNTSARIIEVIERYLDNVPLQNGERLYQKEPNIAIHVKEYNATDFKFKGAGAAAYIAQAMDNFTVYDDQTEVQSDKADVSIKLPPTLFENEDKKDQNQRISFVVYRSRSFFAASNKSKSELKEDTIRKNTSYVISASVKGQRITNLTDPVVTIYRPFKEGIDVTTQCVFWNFTEKNGTGDWSSEGCSNQGTMNGLVTCNCKHLTNFAILMNIMNRIGVKFNNLTRRPRDGTCTSNCKYYLKLCLSFSENLDCSLFKDTTLSWKIKPGESKKFELYDQLTDSNETNPIRPPLKTWNRQEVVLLADIWRKDTTPIFIEQLRIQGRLPSPINDTHDIDRLQIKNCSAYFCLEVSLFMWCRNITGCIGITPPTTTVAVQPSFTSNSPPSSTSLPVAVDDGILSKLIRSWWFWLCTVAAVLLILFVVAMVKVKCEARKSKKIRAEDTSKNGDALVLENYTVAVHVSEQVTNF